MGLFTKESCCICGEKAGLLTRKAIDGREYVCGDCAKRCGVDIDRWKFMTMEDVQAQLEERESDRELLQNDFQETDVIEREELLGSRGLLAVDGNNGWWYRLDREEPIVFTFEQIVDYRLDITSRIQEGPGPGRGAGRRGGPEGRRPGGILGILDDLMGPPTPDPRLPMCPPDYKVMEMKFIIRLTHPCVHRLVIDLTSWDPSYHEIREGYRVAWQMIELFDHYHEEFNFAEDLEDFDQKAYEEEEIVEEEEMVEEEALPVETPAGKGAPARSLDDTVEGIKKFKELLDMGAITQEEYDAKKKELLGM